MRTVWVVLLAVGLVLTIAGWAWVGERPLRTPLGRASMAAFTLLCLLAVAWYAILLDALTRAAR